jgi:DNA-binding CsgD family transcriptional regulator
MELMLMGLTSKEIARQKMNSVGTINSHRARIYEKLQIHKIGELFALENQLRDERE